MSSGKIVSPFTPQAQASLTVAKESGQLENALMSQFSTSFNTAAVFKANVAEGIGKLLLRSPEVSIDIVSGIVSLIDFDVGPMFVETFANILTNQLKSGNELIRNSAVILYRNLFLKSQQARDRKAALEILLKSPLSKLPEQRASLFTVLGDSIPHIDIASFLLPAIENLFGKETNEAALSALVASYANYSSFLFETYSRLTNEERKSNLKLFDASVKFIINGLKDTKAVNRRCFMLAINQILTATAIEYLPSATLGDLSKELSSHAEKMQAQSLLLIDSKKETASLSEALSVVYCLFQISLKVPNSLDALWDETLNASSISSFIFAERFYSKASSGLDQFYLSRIVMSIIESDDLYAKAGLETSSGSLPAILLWLILHGDFKARRFIAETMTRLSSTTPAMISRLSEIVLKGIKQSLSSIVEPEKNIWNDKPVRSSAQYPPRIVSALTGVIPISPHQDLIPRVQKVLSNFFLVCSLPIITSSYGSDLWIKLCFRAGIAPTFIQSLPDSFYISLVVDGSEFRTARKDAIRLGTQIAAPKLVPTLLNWSLNNISNQDYSDVTFEDIAIWKTEEGSLFFDPLKKDELLNTKGLSKDEKWELELKKELSKKNSSSVKLTKAEVELQKAQLEKESNIRAHIQSLKDQLDDSLDILESVLDGSLLDTLSDKGRLECVQFGEKLTYSLLSDLLSREYLVVRKGKETTPSGVLAGSKSKGILNKVAKILLGDLANHLDLDDITNVMLLALGFDFSLMPSKYKLGYLNEIISTLLNAITEYAEEEGLLSASAFTYIYPLFLGIVKKFGRIPLIKDRPYTEIVMSAADLIIRHAGIEGMETLFLPRQSIVHCLVDLIELYPRLRGTGKAALLQLASATSMLELSEDESGTDPVEILITKLTEVLLDGLLNQEAAVRESCLLALNKLPLVDSMYERFVVRVWMCRSDDEEAVFIEADLLWEDLYQESTLMESLVIDLIALIVHPNSAIRSAAGRATTVALSEYPQSLIVALDSLYELYHINSIEPKPEFDSFGMIVPESINRPDCWGARSGVALALSSLEPLIIEKNAVLGMFEFLIEKEALGDRNEAVQQQMLAAGLSLLNTSATKYIKELLDLFDSHLSMPSGTSKKHDTIREAIVVLMGTLAQHLDQGDPRISETIQKLLDTLTTPSESVQIAISECLPALIKVSKDQVPSLVKDLLHTLFESEKYGHRRGAAYGLAGIVKGTGISALKDYTILAHLKAAIEDKKSITRREGALFAFETLSFTLGRTFEPYVVQLLPYLLTCFGDANRQIRDATEDTCRVIMSKLSAHCVKLLLPSLLNGLQERAFRTKIGSIEVMASMSSLAPKQLSQSLPTIVPKICDALGDSHQKVQEAAREALVQFGKVIKNPEIQELVPRLILALVNPNNKTLDALAALLETTFVHYIDAPSLALLVPIIHRGMKERSAETKKKAAQIMGNMSSLTDPRDLIPYLDTLLPPLKEILVDPVPEARATAAKAFGSMVNKLGEERFPTLVTELLTTLQSDTSGVDRSGSAQGLSEVLAGVGIPRLEGLLPLILNNANSTKTYIREGFTMLLVYLPTTFGEAFTPYIVKIVPTMLEGLADESDTVRDAALHVGQVIVRNYSKSAVSLLLPELQKGLFNDNWRIRQNSVQLIGDLVFRIAGITQLLDSNDAEEGFGTETHRTALKTALGDQYEIILASLYIVRADSSGLVRQSAVGVWKAVVANTPKTLKQILPMLMSILLASLASESSEKRGVAARTLGDLVRRLGDSVLTLIIPILGDGLEKGDSDTREGVCIGLCEMMQSAGRSQEEFLEKCIPLVRKGLVDSSPEVRSAAAQAFDILHQNMGSKAIDDVIPVLLGGIKSDKGGFALEGLKEIMAVRSNVVFPILIPTLLSRPMTQSNAQALASLVSVAGSSLNRRLDNIIPSLLEELNDEGCQAKEDVMAALEAIMHSVEEEGVYRVVGILTETINDGSLNKKINACKCMSMFFTNTTESFEDYLNDTIRLVVGLFCDDSSELMKEGWNCLDAIVKRLRKEDLDRYVHSLKAGIRDAESNLNYGEEIAAFNLPKGLAPVLAILLQGLMTGNAETREASAYALGDVITRTSEGNLKPYVTQITGPLIRVIGDRFVPSVKTAILSTLALLLSKVPSMLKPFLPQLQRTFVKSLSEPGGTAAMRSKTAQCLSVLIPLQTRLDPLVLEFVQGIKTADESVEPAMWEAMSSLLICVGRDSEKSISEASQSSITTLVIERLVKSPENSSYQRVGAAKSFGRLCNVLPIEKSRELMMELITSSHLEGWTGLHGMLLALERVYVDAFSIIADTDFSEVAGAKAIECLLESKGPVVEAAILLANQILEKAESFDRAPLILALVELSQPTTELTDARREAIVAIKRIAKSNPEVVTPLLSTIVPALMLSVRDRTIPVKLAAERALCYALQVKEEKHMEKYLKTLQGPSSKSIGDYARRVLVNIAQRDSDDESEY